MQTINSNSQTKLIIQFIVQVCKSKKKIYEDNLKSRIKRKFKITLTSVEKFFQDYIKKEYLIINDGLVSINILANPLRKEIFRIIKQYPGIYFNLLKKLLKIGVNQLLWHLNALENNLLVNRVDFGKIRAYGLPNVPKIIVTIGFLAFKKSSRKMFEYLCSNLKGPSRKEIMEYIQLSKSTTEYWLKKLRNLNIISVKQGINEQHFLSKDLHSKICFTVKKIKNIDNLQKIN